MSDQVRLQQHLEPFIKDVPVQALQSMALFACPILWARTEVNGRPIKPLLNELMRFRSSDELDAYCAEVLFTDFRNRCLLFAWQTAGPGFAEGLFRCSRAEQLQEMHRNRQPAIFVFTHIGPRHSILPAFLQTGVPIAIFQGMNPRQEKNSQDEQMAAQIPGTEIYWTQASRRASNLKRAVDRLKAGGMVAIGIDGGEGDILMEADFLDRRMPVARGPAVLARMTGAPLIPVTLTWNEGWSIELGIHDPIPLTKGADVDEDADLTSRTVEFFDRFIRQSLGQLRLDRIDWLTTLVRSATVGASSM